MRAANVACGAGVGGIVLARRGIGVAPVVLADSNQKALSFAQCNAQLAGVRAEIAYSHLLDEIEGDVDLVISNARSSAVATQVVRQSLERLARNPSGGTLLLYTGAAVIDGRDSFLDGVRSDLEHSFTPQA
jgi:release factor glutamine methyltransferase